MKNSTGHCREDKQYRRMQAQYKHLKSLVRQGYTFRTNAPINTAEEIAESYRKEGLEVKVVELIFCEDGQIYPEGRAIFAREKQTERDS